MSVLSSVLTEAKGLVDRRFLLNGFFPCLVFLAAGALLLASGNGGVHRAGATYVELPATF